MLEHAGSNKSIPYRCFGRQSFVRGLWTSRALIPTLGKRCLNNNPLSRCPRIVKTAQRSGCPTTVTCHVISTHAQLSID